MAAGCERHDRRELSLASLTLMDPPSALRQGQAIRIAIDPSLTACDALADVVLDVQPGNATDFITVHGYAWFTTGGCGGTTVRRRPIVLSDAIGLSNPNLV